MHVLLFILPFVPLLYPLLLTLLHVRLLRFFSINRAYSNTQIHVCPVPQCLSVTRWCCIEAIKTIRLNGVYCRRISCTTAFQGISSAISDDLE